MKTNYFTKIEDKYVFNLSLIFWHILIVLATLAIFISLYYSFGVQSRQGRKKLKNNHILLKVNIQNQ